MPRSLFLALALLIGLATTIDAKSANTFASVSASSATINGNTITLYDVSGVFTYWTTYAGVHGGTWQTSTVANQFINGHWMGSPDGALYGYTAGGQKQVLGLAQLSSPSYNPSANMLTFNFYEFTPNTPTALTNGATNWVLAGNAKNDVVLKNPPAGTQLYKVSVILDLFLDPTAINAAQVTQPQGNDDSLSDMQLINDGLRVGPFGGE